MIKIDYIKELNYKRKTKDPCFFFSLELKFREPGTGVCGVNHQCF